MALVLAVRESAIESTSVARQNYPAWLARTTFT